MGAAVIEGIHRAIEVVALAAPRGGGTFAEPRGGGAFDAMCRTLALIYPHEIKIERRREHGDESPKACELWVRIQVADLQSSVAAYLPTVGGRWYPGLELEEKWLPAAKAWLQP